MALCFFMYIFFVCGAKDIQRMKIRAMRKSYILRLSFLERKMKDNKLHRHYPCVSLFALQGEQWHTKEGTYYDNH
jgi:hypothetical protein